MKKEYLDLKLDFMFKQLFGQPSRKHITLAFINDLLGREGNDRISDLNYVNTELIKDRIDGKSSRLDLAVVTQSGEHINVEVQVLNQPDMPERILYYWAKTYSSLIHTGEDYSNLTPTIFISILNYPLFPSKNDVFHTKFFIKEENEHFLWNNHLEFHVFDLSSFMVKWRKYRREMKMTKSKELPWLLMFSATDYRRNKMEQEIFSDLEEMAMNIDQVREALVEWETLSTNKENRALYEARAKELRDMLSKLKGAQKVGREEGREEALQEVAMKLLRSGMDVDQVASFVSLPLVEIERIKESF